MQDEALTGPHHIGKLVGEWSLYRVISDALADRQLIFEGHAGFSADDKGLTYTESGTWKQGDWRGQRASQTYLWRETTSRVEVLYRDGRAFHGFVWPGDTGRVEASHDCAPDRYDATYQFELPKCWHLEWRVEGPAKDYVSQTRFIRVEQA